MNSILNLRSVLTLAVVLGSFGCSSSNQEPSARTAQSRPAALDKALAKAGRPNYQQLNHLLVERHARAFAQSGLAAGQAAWKTEEYEHAIADLAPRDASTRAPWDLKVDVEKALVRRNGDRELNYNREHVTIASPLRLGRMQCYSGSTLALLLLRQSEPEVFAKRNMVMIMTSGHILPGFMMPEKGGYRLVGMETTVRGMGRADFGFVPELKRPVRVIDADLFTEIEAVSDQLEDKDAVVQWALGETARRYGIPLKTTEAAVAELKKNLAPAAGAEVQALINSSPFAFGTEADVPPAGDLTRTEADIVDPALSDAKLVHEPVTMGVIAPKPEVETKPESKPAPEQKLEADGSLSDMFRRRKKKVAPPVALAPTAIATFAFTKYGSQLHAFNDDARALFAGTCVEDRFAREVLSRNLSSVGHFISALDSIPEAALAQPKVVEAELNAHVRANTQLKHELTSPFVCQSDKDRLSCQNAPSYQRDPGKFWIWFELEGDRLVSLHVHNQGDFMNRQLFQLDHCDAGSVPPNMRTNSCDSTTMTIGDGNSDQTISWSAIWGKKATEASARRALCVGKACSPDAVSACFL